MEFVILASMNINYVLHIVLRCSKFFGVLIFNFLTRSKENKVTSKELFMGFFFTIGVVLFSSSGSKNNEQSTTMYGLICSGIAFIMDGAVSYFQGKTRNKNMPHITSLAFMQMTNFWCLITAFIFSLMKSSLVPGFTILFTHFDLLIMMLTLASASLIGQIFTFDHINRFGPLSLSLINTIRKIFSIILSIIIYHHPMSNMRYAGLAVIFSVLLSKSFGLHLVSWVKKKLNPKKKKKHN